MSGLDLRRIFRMHHRGYAVLWSRVDYVRRTTVAAYALQLRHDGRVRDDQPDAVLHLEPKHRRRSNPGDMLRLQPLAADAPDGYRILHRMVPLRDVAAVRELVSDTRGPRSMLRV